MLLKIQVLNHCFSSTMFLSILGDTNKEVVILKQIYILLALNSIQVFIFNFKLKLVCLKREFSHMYIPLRFLVIEVPPKPFVCFTTVKVEVVATS